MKKYLKLRLHFIEASLWTDCVVTSVCAHDTHVRACTSAWRSTGKKKCFQKRTSFFFLFCQRETSSRRPVTCIFRGRQLSTDFPAEDFVIQFGQVAESTFRGT